MAGFKCLGSTALPQECPDGTYQDETRQSTCKKCPAGVWDIHVIAFTVMHYYQLTSTKLNHYSLIVALLYP